MIKLSAVVSAYNEEEKIVVCLRSLSFCDEIILIDNESTDQTVEKAKPYATHIYSRKNNRMLNVNKNFGFSHAHGEWILNLDADEYVLPSLAEQIKGIISQDNSDINGYLIPRKNIIFGKWIQHTGWFPDFQLRLFKNGKGRFEEQHIHELIRVDGQTDQLTEPLHHENYQSIIQFLRKHMMIYAPEEAKSLVASGYTLVWTDALVMPVKEFISRFFARQGYKDGLHGLMLSLLMSMYHLMIFAYVWEETKFVEAPTEDILSEVEQVSQKIGKDIRYWFVTEKLRYTTSKTKKLLLKLQQKLS